MSFTVNLPPFECFLDNSFLYDGEKGHGEYTECLVHGASSISGRALGFHVLLRNGASIGRLPVSALRGKKITGAPLNYLQLWDCPSYDMTVNVYDAFAGCECIVKLRDTETTYKDRKGRYMMTFDWYGSSIAEGAGDFGWKSAHLIALGCGHYCLQPNNRVLFDVKAWVDNAEWPLGYVRNSRVWSVE
jgi:hypothetical protein